MEKYVCIHCHFYQPPRENPWLLEIESEDSAYPFHDWNERINAECYAPNTASRILDGRHHVVKIVNNYTRVSFNVGPTLLSWMEHKAPDIYAAILRSDRESIERFSGHGNAMAQAYNHMIMPLANRRDKYTQVVWGIRDFEQRFQRQPEGMWLPETAVDIETLDVMAELGIRFTVLAPSQAKRVRKIASAGASAHGAWADVSGERVDPTRPYRVRLSSGREIAVFFYDGPISRAVAFEHLLKNGDRFAHRLTGVFAKHPVGRRAQIVHIAADGETYGHHHRHGDMALAYATDMIESKNLARLTNYAEYLTKFPPEYEAEIFENSSWSCAHGVERWRADCGCRVGHQSGWRQAWRAPLRAAMDSVRDAIMPLYETRMRDYCDDPWALRDRYIDVVLNRSAAGIKIFMEKNLRAPLDEAGTVEVLKLLEAQRHAMLMYTSCGWFFDDISGIETVQNMKYAARAIQLTEEVFGKNQEIESQFLEHVRQAKSNVPQLKDGKLVFENRVRSAKVNAMTLGAHFAVSSLFESYEKRSRVFCFDVDIRDFKMFDAGRSKSVMGHVDIVSKITRDKHSMYFGAIHLGDHNIIAGVKEFAGAAQYAAFKVDALESLSRADYPQVIRILDRHFGLATYSLKNLFKDEQRKIINLVLNSTLTEIESNLSSIYDGNYALMRYLTDLQTPLPPVLKSISEFIQNREIEMMLRVDEVDAPRLRGLIEEARSWHVNLDRRRLSLVFQEAVERIMRDFKSRPDDAALLTRLIELAQVVCDVPFDVELWKVQNMCYDLSQTIYPAYGEKSASGDEAARHWVAEFRRLLEILRVNGSAMAPRRRAPHNEAE